MTEAIGSVRRGAARSRTGALALCVLCSTGPALSDPLGVHGSAQVAKALGGHQARELGVGAALGGGVELALLSRLGLDAELGAVWLPEAAAPSDPYLAPQGDGSAAYAGLGLRLHPFGRRRLSGFTATGLWLAAHAGGARTGSLTRALTHAGVGYEVGLGEERLGVGPALSWLHVFQPDHELRPADANILALGIHVSWQPAAAPEAPRDRDRDGLLDPVDRCPLDPEDKDGFEDEDGCPEPDNDKDGILDPKDKCPNEPEDKDGFQDEDGCPDADNDKDGILDPKDKCPNEPEDEDGFEDQDGCPDADNDKDGILDPKDECPNEPETPNDYADDDGCPDAAQVRVVGDKILLDDRVHFWTNSARLRPVSYPLLERVAKLIEANPSYVHIEVQGHTDERGPKWFNTKLSEQRAASVREFLVSRGIEASRLSSRGFGADKPLVERKSERAWFINRRVEFSITRELPAGSAAAEKRGPP